MRTPFRLWERLTFSAAFLLMGFSFSVTQSLLVREMLVSFAGNELSIGIVLGSWLLLEAVGSGLVGRLVLRKSGGVASYGRLQILFAALLLPVLYLAFGLRDLLGVVPGQGLGLFPILISSFLLLVPLGLVDGAMFTVGCRMDGEANQGVPGAVKRVYVCEAVGGIIGGLVFTYLFLPYLNAVQVGLILAALNLASASSLATSRLHGFSRGKRSVSSLASALLPLVLLVCSLGLLITPGADRIHKGLVASQWRGYDLAFYRNSIYGNVAAIRQHDQLTFFANGVPILTSPVPDIVLVEEAVHLPLLFVRQPRRALVLSGGLGGVITELLKYPLERVDYAELDPLLIQAVASLPTPLTQAELADPRLHIHEVDGRLLVRRLLTDPPPGGGSPRRESYDLILINLPSPTTLQLNRFYTAEFYKLADDLLADDGVVVSTAPGSLTHLSPATQDLHAALHATLTSVFPHVRPIPGDVTLWLASRSEALEEPDIEGLVAGWEARGLSSNLISPFHIRLKLDERWLTWFWSSLRGRRAPTINRDLHPSALLSGLALWNELFSPTLAPYFELLAELDLLMLAIPVLALAAAAILLLRMRPQWRVGAIPIAVATTGFAGMTADLIVVFAFQVFYGYVYQYVGLLITAFMAGLRLGGWVTAQKSHRWTDEDSWRRGRRWFLALEAGLLCFWVVLSGALLLYQGASQASGTMPVGPALFFVNLLAGFLVGAQFVLANRIHLRAQTKTGNTAGTLYAADLAGAFVAALLVSTALIPALGIVQTCLLVATLKGASLALMLAVRKSR